MALEFVEVEFKRVGKLAAGETEAQKYKARQIKEGTFPKDSAGAILTAALDVTGGNLDKVAEAIVSGLNHQLRLEAGGYDEWQKAARKLMGGGDVVLNTLGLNGKSVDEVAAWLKARAA
jgi:hypothetical protein